MEYFSSAPPAQASVPSYAAPVAAPPPTRAALPLEALGLGVGGVLLLVAPFLPWISVFAFGVSGIDLRYGVVALVAGVLALVSAAEAASGSVVGPARRTLVHGLALLGGVAAAIAALAVWGRLQEVLATMDGFGGLGGELSFDDSPAPAADPFGSGLEALGEQLVDALAPQAAAGLWLALAAGVLVAASALVAARR